MSAMVDEVEPSAVPTTLWADMAINRDMIAEHVSTLFGNAESGWVGVWFNHPRGRDQMLPSDWITKGTVWFECPLDLGEVVGNIVWLNRGGFDVYLPVSTRVANLGVHERGGSDQVLAQHALVVDIDVNTPGHHRTANVAVDTTAAFDLLRAFPLRPTLTVSTGGGIQAWWVLAEGAPMSDELRLLLAGWRNTQRQLSERTGVPQDLGVTGDPARVMRCAGSINWKVADSPKRTGLLYPLGQPVQPSDLDDHLVEGLDLARIERSKRATPAIVEDHETPFSRFEAVMPLEKLLPHHGWRKGRTGPLGTFWKRPGGHSAQSALQFAGSEHLFMYSSGLENIGLLGWQCYRGAVVACAYEKGRIDDEAVKAWGQELHQRFVTWDHEQMTKGLPKEPTTASRIDAEPLREAAGGGSAPAPAPVAPEPVERPALRLVRDDEQLDPLEAFERQQAAAEEAEPERIGHNADGIWADPLPAQLPATLPLVDIAAQIAEQLGYDPTAVLAVLEAALSGCWGWTFGFERQGRCEPLRHYLVLLGSSGSGKNAVVETALHLLAEAWPRWYGPGGRRVVSGIASGEALGIQFGTEVPMGPLPPRPPGEEDDPEVKAWSIEQRRRAGYHLVDKAVLWWEDELDQVSAVAGRKGSTMTATVRKLHSGHQVSNFTKRTANERNRRGEQGGLHEVHPSILWCAPPESYRSMLFDDKGRLTDNVTNGFCGRLHAAWIPTGRRPQGRNFHPEVRQRIVGQLRHLLAWAEETHRVWSEGLAARFDDPEVQRIGGILEWLPVPVQASREAWRRLEAIETEIEAERRSWSPQLRALTARWAEQVMRTAALHTITQGALMVEPAEVDAGLERWRHTLQCQRVVLRLGQLDQRQQRILEFLERQEGRSALLRDIIRGPFNSAPGARVEAEAAVNALRDAGFLRVEQLPRRSWRVFLP